MCPLTGPPLLMDANRSYFGGEGIPGMSPQQIIDPSGRSAQVSPQPLLMDANRSSAGGEPGPRRGHRREN